MSACSGAAARPIVFLLAAIAVVLAVVFLAFRGDTDRPAVRSLTVGSAASSAASTALSNDAGGVELLGGASEDLGRSGQVKPGVRLRGQGKLDGHVYERVSALPVANVRVDLLTVPPAGSVILGKILRMGNFGGDQSERVKPVAIAQTDNSGAFHFEGVRQGTYYVEARGDYHVPENVTRARVAPSGTGGPIEVFVIEGGRIVGSVLGLDGRPAAHAKVTVVPGPGIFITSAMKGELRWLYADADENGRFVVGGVPPGDDYEVTAWREGFAVSHALNVVVRPLLDTNVTVQARPGGSIVGRVLSKKKDGEPTPLGGAHLAVVSRGLRNLRCIEEILLLTHVETGPDGAFTIQHAPPGDVDVLVVAWEHLPKVGATVAIADNQVSASGDIVLEGAPMVLGTVTDSAGIPLEGVKLRWNPIDFRTLQFDMSFAPLVIAAVKGFDIPGTRADGRFFAGPFAGEPDWDITFSKPGYVETVFKWNPERDGPDVTVKMERGGAVEGVVMDVVKSEPVTSFTINGPDRVDQDKDSPSALNPFSGGQLVEDEAGRFRCESVKPGNSSLTFTAPGYLAQTVAVEVLEGGVQKGLIVSLQPGGIARGRVLDADGKPIAGAQVVANSASRKAPPSVPRADSPSPPEARRDRMRNRRSRANQGPMGDGSEIGPDAPYPPGLMNYAAALGLMGDKAGITKADGTFELSSIEAGDFTVMAFHKKWSGGQSETFVMPEGGGIVENVLVTLSNGGSIEGTVHDRYARPVAEELVIAFSPGAMMPGSRGGAGGGMFQGHSDEQGHYLIEHVAPGTYFLVATRGDAELNPMSFFGTLNFDVVNVSENEVAHYDLLDSSAGGCRVHGTVTYKGEPVSRGNLAAMNFETESILGVDFKLARIDAKGHYEFAGLAPGDYQLNIDGAGPQVRMTLEVPDQPELELELALPEGGLEGVVSDEQTNEPIEGAQVTVRLPDNGQEGAGLLGQFISRDGRSLNEWTDKEGKFAFERLQGGEYTITVRGPRGKDPKRGSYAPSEKQTVKVIENRTERGVTIRLQPALILAGRVLDENKSPVSGANVFVRLASGGLDVFERARSDDSGQFEIKGLSPGTYVATATAKGFAESKSGDLKLERNTAKPPEAEITLQRGVHVFVRVYGSNGQPVSGARADLVPAKGKRSTDPSQADRVFQNLFSGEGASDSEGRIDLGQHAPGEYRLEVQRGFSKAVDPKAVVPADQTEVELKIDLP